MGGCKKREGWAIGLVWNGIGLIWAGRDFLERWRRANSDEQREWGGKEREEKSGMEVGSFVGVGGC